MLAFKTGIVDTWPRQYRVIYTKSTSEFRFIVEKIIKDRSNGGSADSLASDWKSHCIADFRSLHHVRRC